MAWLGCFFGIACRWLRQEGASHVCRNERYCRTKSQSRTRVGRGDPCVGKDLRFESAVLLVFPKQVGGRAVCEEVGLILHRCWFLLKDSRSILPIVSLHEVVNFESRKI